MATSAFTWGRYYVGELRRMLRKNPSKSAMAILMCSMSEMDPGNGHSHFGPGELESLSGLSRSSVHRGIRDLVNLGMIHELSTSRCVLILPHVADIGSRQRQWSTECAFRVSPVGHGSLE